MVESRVSSSIDYFINDAPAVWRVAGGFLSPERELRGLYTPLTQEHLAWAVRQDDEALRERLNATLSMRGRRTAPSTTCSTTGSGSACRHVR